jgi:hypothetical protein
LGFWFGLRALGGLAALVLAGCTTPQSQQVQFISFDEPQQAWPTLKWGLMHLVDGFPIYGLNQLPPEPYEVRGFIYVSSDRPSPSQEVEHAVVQRARQEGAEAARLTNSRTASGRLGVEAADYLIIQFKTNALGSVLDRINVYLALNPSATNSTDQEGGARQEDLERLRDAILRHSQIRVPGDAAQTNTASPHR